MIKSWPPLLVFVLVLLPHLTSADEAITHQGRHYLGTLQPKNFLLANTDKTLPLDQLRLVLLPEHAAPLPHCRLTHQILFVGDQRLTGALLTVGQKDVQFRIVTGEILTLARDKLQGIVQADGHLIQWAEDFEGPKNGVQWLGKPIFHEEHAFSGKKSLLVTSASGDISLIIPAPQKTNTARRVHLHFLDPAWPDAALAKLQFIFEIQDSKTPITILLSNKLYYVDGGYRIQASRGWHLLQLDWHQGEVRTFIDDFYLGSRTIPMASRCAALHFSMKGKGNLWIDALHLTEKAPPMKRTPGPAELDEIWLASGDQIFGDLLLADERDIVFAAPFGKRSYSWSNVRGIFFRSPAKPTIMAKNVTVSFRSGPGLSADQLTGSIVDLNNHRLLLHHQILGDFTIARTRLARVRFSE